MSRRPDRLYQLGFDEQLQLVQQEVTPPGFAGLHFPTREPALPARLGRFVREAREPVQITSPAVAAHYFQEHIFNPFEECDQEELWILLLNTKNVVLAEVMAYRGTVNTTQVRLPELFKEAVRLNAPGIILAHNHPSGRVDASPEDLHLTRQALQVAETIQIDLHDHLIIGAGIWVSIIELLANEKK